MEIQVSVRNVYGRELIYPENDAARLLCQLVGTKTLSRDQLRLARELGHEIVPVLGSAADLVSL